MLGSWLERLRRGYKAFIPSPYRPTDQSSSKGKGHSDALWPWVMVSLGYLTFGAILLFDRWAEIGPLLGPAISPVSAASTGTARLPLNSIGDILAGFFAPLAFLWLFVATLLQRRELKLQRDELSDTREVLAEQRSELARSAEENNKQTAIMQRTLDVSRTREVYDEFSLGLYFYARGTAEKLKLNLEFNAEPDSMGVTMGALFGPVRSFAFSQTDSSTVDDFYELLKNSIDNLFLNYGNDIIIPANWGNNVIVQRRIKALIQIIESTEQGGQYHENLIIRRRSAGLNFGSLKFSALKLMDRFT